MKLWKKIVIIVSTLIVVISTMILPVFADSWVNDNVYPNVLPVGPRYDVTLLVENKFFNETYHYDLETKILQPGEDIMDRPTQSIAGKLSASTIRNSAYQPLEERDLLYRLSLRNKYISTTDPSSSRNGGYYLEYLKIGEPTIDNSIGNIYNSDITLTIRNYVWHQSFDRLRPEVRFSLPAYDTPVEYVVDVKTTITALRPIFNYDNNSLSFEPVVIETKGSYSTNDLFDIRTFSIVPDNLATRVKPKIIAEGRESEIGGTGYVFIDRIDFKISNATYPDNGVNFDDYGIRLPFNTLDKGALGFYMDVKSPDDYDAYMTLISMARLEYEPVTLGANGFWDFIETSIGGFFDFEVLPNITIGGIILGIVALLLFITFLKIFAGG